MPLNDLFAYKLSGSEPGVVRAVINLNAKHRLYTGHFPDKPVTPGVALIEIIRIILSDVLGKELMFTGARDIKFIASVVPPDMDNLGLEIKYGKSQEGIPVHCTLSGNDKVYMKIRGTFSENEE
ncbi:MAG: hypothetical protein PVF73_13220 [Bacteroidales bacterium]|jgi:3-hydroxyacyl-[acyl-carrier-protein] dehydratase